MIYRELEIQAPGQNEAGKLTLYLLDYSERMLLSRQRPLVLICPGGAYELFKDKHGFVIGGMDGMVYKEYVIQMEPGAQIFLYTDGVPEATDADKNMFGTDRMIDALNLDPDAGPEQILGHVRDAVSGFVRDAEQFDDLTMLGMEYRGKK